MKAALLIVALVVTTAHAAELPELKINKVAIKLDELTNPSYSYERLAKPTTTPTPPAMWHGQLDMVLNGQNAVPKPR